MKTLLDQLYHFGQSPWLDYISRAIINNGHLEKMIDKGIVGLTSNPTIFDKAIQSNAQDSALYYHLGLILLNKLERYKEAKDVFKKSRLLVLDFFIDYSSSFISYILRLYKIYIFD